MANNNALSSLLAPSRELVGIDYRPAIPEHLSYAEHVARAKKAGETPMTAEEYRRSQQD